MILCFPLKLLHSLIFFSVVILTLIFTGSALASLFKEQKGEISKEEFHALLLVKQRESIAKKKENFDVSALCTMSCLGNYFTPSQPKIFLKARQSA